MKMELGVGEALRAGESFMPADMMHGLSTCRCSCSASDADIQWHKLTIWSLATSLLPRIVWKTKKKLIGVKEFHLGENFYIILFMDIWHFLVGRYNSTLITINPDC
ncbi:unnamed protein product [Musa acuminata subsp. burmannicoides]